MKNWRTTVAGLSSAAALTAAGVRDTLVHGQPINWALVAAGFAVAVFSFLAKDAANVQKDK